MGNKPLRGILILLRCSLSCKSDVARIIVQQNIVQEARFMGRWVDTSKASKNPFSIGVNRIDRRFLHDPAAARSNVKAKKILYHY